MSAPVLTRRALNRALLARQWLDQRRQASVPAAVRHLAGMQAQQAAPPFTGLWTRVENFQTESLRQAIFDKELVRATAMRATLHLLTAADYLEFHSALAPMLQQAFQSQLGKHASSIPMDLALTAARRAFSKDSLTFHELRDAMKEQFPDCNERVIGYGVKTHLELVTVPGDSPYAFQPNSPYTLAQKWLGKPPRKSDATTGLVERYLAAFGPATPADFQAWSGMRGAAAHFATLRAKLSVFQDENGRELFDLPDAPRPGEDTPVPVRFLPEFDNVVLAHKDRSRIIDDEYRSRIVSKNLLVAATFLVDGFVSGVWSVKATKSKAVLSITAFNKLRAQDKKSLTEEGHNLLAFLHPDSPARSITFA